MEDISSIADYLRSMAQVTTGNWDYSREQNIKNIRYRNDPADKLLHRIKNMFHWLFFKKTIFGDKITLSFRFRLMLLALRKEDNLPDGGLGNGKILTHWEEDGEYIQLVQPSVGKLLADFLEDEPDNKHAQLIANKIDKIMKDYSRRISEKKNVS
jgi:hypothetical protein